MDATCKPHAICVPFPLSTHINSMLKFAKLLHHKGFHVTFVNAAFQHKSILSAKGPNALDGLPDFRFESIAIDVPSSKPGSPDYFVSVREAIRKGFLSPFRNLVTKLNETERPVTCLVSDGASTHTVTLAEELGIPAVLFWAVGANGVLSINRHQELVRRCFAPRDESKANEDLDATTDFFAGKKGIRMRDVPSIIQTKYSPEYILDVTVKEAERTSKASAIVIHTFEALEKHAIDELASTFHRVYSIGPLPLLLNQDVKRSQVEEAVVELLQGDRGKKIQEKAQYWKKVAQEATEPHGLSSKNLDSLVNEVLLSKP
ncbi:hypothetical protein RJ639_029862 [Escallonia herrerae]|uniref:Glycosyltransferase N-terminal domain-containing protein n=1 Tax=Escallonia herrerae TaxID=1293975 RepID=A0AA88X2Z4_9ASTE|nr:hypothetical protein RJ639_029862 [Escallonia herrerae]